MKRRAAVGLSGLLGCTNPTPTPPSAPGSKPGPLLTGGASTPATPATPATPRPGSPTRGPANAAPTPDTILVTIETTRADRVGPLYGHPRNTFPKLSERAKSGRVYTRAYSSSSWTLPSMVSIYTGRSPIEHGVEAVDRQLSTKHETLGKVLQQQGVQAAFFGVNPVFVVDRGLAEGFTHWQAEVGWHAGRINQAVFEWVEHHRDARQPTFLHIHYFDPHCPYIPPKGHAVTPAMVPSGRLVPEDRLAEMGGCYRIDGADGTPVRDLDIYFDRYDRELHVVDEAIDRLLDRLAEYDLLGPEDRLVVTADHGEAFWEHDDYGHSHTLWAETTRVPLVIWDHDGAGMVETPTGLTALFRGLRSAGPGTPIRPELGGPVVQSTKAAGVPWVAVIDKDERWLSNGTHAWTTNPMTDPHDRSMQPVALHPEPAALTQARSHAEPAPALSPSDEEREQLRALGYSL